MSHNLRRRALTGALVFGLIAAWAPTSVFAHVEFEDAPATVAPNADIALTMHVPNERDASNFNVAVATQLPEGWTGVSCEEKPTWTCEIATVSDRVEIHFTKDAGAAAAEDEIFEFTLHSSATVGAVTFPTLQTYDTGEEVGWVGDPGSENPAPTLEIAAGGAGTTTTANDGATTTVAAAGTTLAPATTSPAATTIEPATTAAATEESTVDTVTILDSTATTAADSDSDDDGNTGAIIAIVVLVIAAAVAGTIIYMRRHKPPTVPPTSGGSPTVGG